MRSGFSYSHCIPSHGSCPQEVLLFYVCLIITRNMSIFIFGVYDKYTVQEKNECKREMNARLSLVNKG